MYHETVDYSRGTSPTRIEEPVNRDHSPIATVSANRVSAEIPRRLQHEAFGPTNPHTVYTLGYPTGCLSPDRTNKRNTPGHKLGVLRAGVLVSVAVMVAGVLVLLGRLFHDSRLGGEELQTCALIVLVTSPRGGAYSSAEKVNRVSRSLSCSASPGPITESRRSASGSAAT
jgi:hypothetical protein